MADFEFDFEPELETVLADINAPRSFANEKKRQDALDAAALSAPQGMSRQKLEEKFRTVVCRHRLRGLCMKGEQCEFLHQYDEARMPLCRWGTNCKIKDCPYRHVAEDDKPECVFYTHGFCPHGAGCRYRHISREREEMPLIADFQLGAGAARARRRPRSSPRAASARRRPAARAASRRARATRAAATGSRARRRSQASRARAARTGSTAAGSAT